MMWYDFAQAIPEAVATAVVGAAECRDTDGIGVPRWEEESEESLDARAKAVYEA